MRKSAATPSLTPMPASLPTRSAIIGSPAALPAGSVAALSSRRISRARKERQPG